MANIGLAEDRIVTREVDLAIMHCGVCSGTYAIAERYRSTKYEDGGYWHCPYCQSSWGYDETEIQRLQKKQKQLEMRLDTATIERAAARRETEHMDRRRRAEKGAKTKLLKRASRGVCAHCGRQFVNVARHMKSKHPEQIGPT